MKIKKFDDSILVSFENEKNLTNNYLTKVFKKYGIEVLLWCDDDGLAYLVDTQTKFVYCLERDVREQCWVRLLNGLDTFLEKDDSDSECYTYDGIKILLQGSIEERGDDVQEAAE